MKLRGLLALGFCCFSISSQEYGFSGPNALAMPSVGDHHLRILSPSVLELSLITTKSNETSRVNTWDFVGENFSLKLPSAGEFQVLVNGKPVSIRQVGFKRRPVYAPLKKRDLRILNNLYLDLSAPIPEGAAVVVTNPNEKLWRKNAEFKAVADPMRFNPAIHVNQVGYQPAFPKKAMAGFYLGSLGEMNIPEGGVFRLIDPSTGKDVFQGQLRSRLDKGFTYSPTPYQKVFEADFSQFNTPGIYRLQIADLGASFPFQIHEGTLATFARTYALGLYHQRCGTNNVLPFTRFVHDPCHTAPAEVPTNTKEFAGAQQVIAQVSSDAKRDPHHTAPQLKNSDASLYPFVRQGKIDVSGGHHDAGDYSKYTINSAGLIHSLMFAVDSLPGVSELDNMGLPESGDGKSDVLQEAKWEADFLAKMQDNDGAFYFLVYPKTREYEDNVLPDKGDPQIVWPKNTSATAAAVAALAEAGSSATMKKQFPEAAENYKSKALRGWAFLERALAKYGKDGAYQKLTHYGDEFGHNDELAWASAALFAATGNKQFETKLKEWFNPQSPETRRWSWWSAFEGYGCAARTYAFAARNGKLPASKLDAEFLKLCERLLDQAARDSIRFSQESAYGTSFPDPNKANKNAGWYFSSERGFDITVAWQLKQEPKYLEAILGNLNYEAGCNPVNVSYITGLGWQRQREIVHQYAQNDQRVLPPSGIPLGNIQAGFAYLYPYKKELGELPYPPDGAAIAPYPFYDRWSDSFNTTTEFVIMDQGRSLASLAFWMAQTPLKAQTWKAAPAQITGLPRSVSAEQPVSARLNVSALNPQEGQIVWEARDEDPRIASELQYSPRNVGEQWVEAEALWPDGRRAFAASNFLASASLNVPPNPSLSQNIQPTAQTAALYHLDDNLNDATGRNPPLALAGKTALDTGNVSWMRNRQGSALRFHDLGDKATVSLSPSALGTGPIQEVSLEAMVFVQDYKGYNRGNAKIISFTEDWNASLEYGENIYEGAYIKGGTILSLKQAQLTNVLSPKQWHHLKLTANGSGYEVRVDGKILTSAKQSELANWGKKAPILELGNFDGWIDEIAITSRSPGGHPPAAAAPAAVVQKTVEAAPKLKTPLTQRVYEPGKINALFLQTDAETKGNWSSQYGRSGYKLIGGPENIPASITITPQNHTPYSWAEKSEDPRALVKPSSKEGIVACWYNEKAFSIDITSASSNPYQLSIYVLDWDRLRRSQTIEAIDPLSKETLDRQLVSEFQEGKYVTWLISGSIRLQFTREGGPNTLVMGMFFDPPAEKAATLIKTGK